MSRFKELLKQHGLDQGEQQDRGQANRFRTLYQQAGLGDIPMRVPTTPEPVPPTAWERFTSNIGQIRQSLTRPEDAPPRTPTVYNPLPNLQADIAPGSSGYQGVPASTPQEQKPRIQLPEIRPRTAQSGTKTTGPSILPNFAADIAPDSSYKGVPTALPDLSERIPVTGQDILTAPGAIAQGVTDSLGLPAIFRLFGVDRQEYEEKVARRFGGEVSPVQQALRGAGQVGGSIGQLVALGGVANTLAARAGLTGAIAKIASSAGAGAASGAIGAYGAGADAEQIVKEAVKTAAFHGVGGLASSAVSKGVIEQLRPIAAKHPEYAIALNAAVAASKGLARGTAGAAAQAGIGALTGEEVSLDEVIRTGLVMAASEAILSVLSEFPFSRTVEPVRGKRGGVQRVRTVEQLRADGYEEVKSGTGIYVRYHPETGRYEQEYATIKVLGTNVYTKDIWAAEKKLGRKLTPVEIARSGGEKKYFWELVNRELGAEAVNQPLDLSAEFAPEPPAQPPQPALLTGQVASGGDAGITAIAKRLEEIVTGKPAQAALPPQMPPMSEQGLVTQNLEPKLDTPVLPPQPAFDTLMPIGGVTDGQGTENAYGRGMAGEVHSELDGAGLQSRGRAGYDQLTVLNIADKQASASIAQRGTAGRPDVYGITDGQVFYDALKSAKENSPHGAYVTLYEPSDYEQAKLYLTKGGEAGVAIKPDGDIVSVFKNPSATHLRGVTNSTMVTAIKNGGLKLDCFAGFLPDLYSRFGFRPVARLAFSDEHKPVGWNYERDGRPEVVYMAHDGTPVTEIEQWLETNSFPATPDLSAVPLVDTYEQALELQNAAIVPNRAQETISEPIPSASMESQAQGLTGGAGAQAEASSVDAPQAVPHSGAAVSVDAQPAITQEQAIQALEETLQQLDAQEAAQKKGGLDVNFDLQAFAKHRQQVQMLLSDIQENGITAEDMPTIREVVQAAKRGAKSEVMMSERTVDNVRGVTAYSVQQPEVAPFLQKKAQEVLYDLDAGTKGERIVWDDPWGMEDRTVTSTKRHQSELVESMLDDFGATYAELKTALEQVRDGEVKSALAKKVEIYLHDALIEGATDAYGQAIAPNEQYAALTRQLEKDFYKRRIDTLSKVFKERETALKQKAKQTTKDAVLANRIADGRSFAKKERRLRDMTAREKQKRADAISRLKESAKRREEKAKQTFTERRSADREKAQQRLAEVKGRARYERAEQKLAYRASVGRIKAEFKRELQERRQAYKERLRADREAMKNKTAKGKMYSYAKRLQRNANKMRPEFKPVANELSKIADSMFRGYGEVRTAGLQKLVTDLRTAPLQDVVADIKAAMPDRDRAKNDYLYRFLQDEDVMPLLADVVGMDGADVASLTNEDFKAVEKLMRYVSRQNEVAGKLIATPHLKSLGEMVSAIADKVSPKEVTREKYSPGRAKKFVKSIPLRWSNFRSIMLDSLDYDDSHVGMQVYNALDEGNNDRYSAQQKMTRKWNELVKGVKMDNWRDEGARQEHVFPSGAKASLNSGEKISLYLGSLNEDNRRHYEEGGGVTARLRKKHAVKLTEQDWADVQSFLTEDEQKVADAIHFMLNNKEQAKGYLNKTSLKLLGYEVAGVDNYFPLARANDLYDKDFSRWMRHATLETARNLRSREGGTGPILIENALDVIDRHISFAAAYYGLAPAIRDARLVLGNADVRDAFNQRFKSDQVVEMFTEKLSRLEGARVPQNEMTAGLSELTHKAQGAAILFNANTIIRQFGSLPKTLGDVTPAQFAKGLVTKAPWEEMIELYPYLDSRTEGIVSPETEAALRIVKSPKPPSKVGGIIEPLHNKTSKVTRKALEAAGRAIGWADRVVIQKQAGGYYAQVLEEGYTGKDAVKEAARRLDQFVKTAQQSGDPLYQDWHSSSQEFVEKNLFAFTSEPAKTAAMLYEGLQRIRLDQDKKKGVGQVVGAISSILASAGIGMFLMNTLRDKEPKEYEEFLLDEVLSIIPLSETIMRGFKGESYETITQGAIDRLFWSFRQVFSNTSTGTDAAGVPIPRRTQLGKFRTLVESVSALSGVPASNIFRELELVINKIDPAAGWEFRRAFMNPTSREVYDKFFPELKKAGSLDKSSSLLDQLRKDMRHLNIDGSKINAAAKRRNANDNPDDDVPSKLLWGLDRWLRKR